MSEPDPRAPPADQEAPPPFLRSWRNIYLLLVIELAALTAVFYALTRFAS